MSLNGRNPSAADLRWRRQRKALDDSRANRAAYRRYVVCKAAEEMEEELTRLRAHLDSEAAKKRTIVERQIGKTTFWRLVPSGFRDGLNPAALAEIERILDEFEDGGA